MKIPKNCRGQVFFKYLWQLPCYKNNQKISEELVKDILKLTSSQKTLTTKTIFHWINGSVIPKWGQKAGYSLAVSHNWQPVDLDDMISIVALYSNELTKESIHQAHKKESDRVIFPRPILQKLELLI